MRYLLENRMRYDIEIDVEDLGISTEDLISLAEDNGDRLYDQDDLETRIEEELAEQDVDLKDTIKTLEDLVKLNEERVALLEGENAHLKMKSADVEAIALFVQTALRVEAIGIADCIRRGDYGV